jgi:hypothetical protein
MKYILSALVLTLYVLFKDRKETDYVAQNEEEISAYVAKQFDRSEKRFRIILL